MLGSGHMMAGKKYYDIVNIVPKYPSKLQISAKKLPEIYQKV